MHGWWRRHVSEPTSTASRNVNIQQRRQHRTPLPTRYINTKTDTIANTGHLHDNQRHLYQRRHQHQHQQHLRQHQHQHSTLTLTPTTTPIDTSVNTNNTSNEPRTTRKACSQTTNVRTPRYTKSPTRDTHGCRRATSGDMYRSDPTSPLIR